MELVIHEVVEEIINTDYIKTTHIENDKVVFTLKDGSVIESIDNFPAIQKQL